MRAALVRAARFNKVAHVIIPMILGYIHSRENRIPKDLIAEAQIPTNDRSVYTSNLQLVLLNALNGHKLSLKDQGCATGNRANTAVAVAVLGGNSQRALLADAHVEQALVPSTAKRISELSK